MAELHVLGQIVGASGFGRNRLFCVWEIVTGGGWSIITGDKDGQTQTDQSELDDFSLWSHPIDVHFAARGIQGWPKISFQVWHMDQFDRLEVFGYGFCDIPSTPGDHRLSALTWRPLGTLRDRMLTRVIGGGPTLQNLDVVHNGLERHRLFTESMGKVHFEISVILRGFENYGVQTA